MDVAAYYTIVDASQRQKKEEIIREDLPSEVYFSWCEAKYIPPVDKIGNLIVNLPAETHEGRCTAGESVRSRTSARILGFGIVSQLYSVSDRAEIVIDLTSYVNFTI